MEQLELAVIGLLLFLILLHLARLISKVEDCSTEIRKFNKGMLAFSEVSKVHREKNRVMGKVKKVKKVKEKDEPVVSPQEINDKPPPPPPS